MSTKVYQFCNWDNGYDQGWVTIAENGVVVCSHVSSTRSCGLHDTSPQMHYQAYLGAFGPDFDVELIEVPQGELPPAAVLEANRLLAALDVSDEVSR